MTTVAIFGAGPAGLMAAQAAAEAGSNVVVYEQGRSPGRKFLLAGRSGLNLTHSEAIGPFLSRYSAGRDLLEPHIGAFDPGAVVAWAAALGQPTFSGSSGRVFPEAFRAAPLLRSWLAHLGDLGAEIRTRHRWLGWSPDGGCLVEDHSGPEPVEATARADATVLAFGGASWPRTGSTGSWTTALTSVGIEVQALTAANCGIAIDWTSHVLDDHEGVPLKNVSLNGTRGDVVITRTGLEGGPVYAHASSIGAAALARLDLFPDITVEDLDTRLQRRRKGATVTAWLTGAGVGRAALAVARDATANELPAGAGAMAELLKAIPLPVSGLAPIDRAISTAGGIALHELTPELMLSGRPGVFACGEMLAWDAPTGGYLLQACLSTGRSAGHNAAEWAAKSAAGSATE